MAGQVQRGVDIIWSDRVFQYYVTIIIICGRFQKSSMRLEYGAYNLKLSDYVLVCWI